MAVPPLPLPWLQRPLLCWCILRSPTTSGVSPSAQVAALCLAAPALALHGVSLAPTPPVASRAAVSGLFMQQSSKPTGSLKGPAETKGDPNMANYGRLSDKLKDADIERRIEEEEIQKRENAVLLAREARARKVELLKTIPDAAKAGTVRRRPLPVGWATAGALT